MTTSICGASSSALRHRAPSWSRRSGGTIAVSRRASAEVVRPGPEQDRAARLDQRRGVGGDRRAGPRRGSTGSGSSAAPRRAAPVRSGTAAAGSAPVASRGRPTPPRVAREQPVGRPSTAGRGGRSTRRCQRVGELPEGRVPAVADLLQDAAAPLGDQHVRHLPGVRTDVRCTIRQNVSVTRVEPAAETRSNRRTRRRSDRPRRRGS